MGFSRQEYWSGLPFPSPGDLPDPGIEPGSHTLQADALLSEPPGKPVVIHGWNLTKRSGLFLLDSEFKESGLCRFPSLIRHVTHSASRTFRWKGHSMGNLFGYLSSNIL